MTRMPPSSALSTTLPVKPSVTMTSAVLLHHVATLDVADEVDAGSVRQQFECLLAQRVALAGLLADGEQADRRASRSRTGDGRRPSPSDRTAPTIRAAPRRWRRRRAGCWGWPGHRYRCGDRRAIDALDPPHAQQRRRHRGAGVAGRDHGRRLAVAHRLGSTDERGVLLATHPLGGVVVHRDDFGGDDQAEVAATLEVLGADENDGDAQGGRSVSTGEDLAGARSPPIASTAIGNIEEVLISRRRWRRGPCTNRRRGTPCAAAWRRHNAGTRCATVPTASRRRRDGYATSSSTSSSLERPQQSSLTKRATRG